MKKALISVIVPCFNVEKFLDDSFKSLEAQTYKNIEKIFVNDGSTDGTFNKLKTYCENKKDCILIDKQNGGLSSARNAGLAKANGEYVYFFDSDDLLHPQILEQLEENIKGADLSACKYKSVEEKFSFERISPRISKVKVKKYAQSQDETMSMYLSCKPLRFAVWNKLYKTELLKKIETWPNIFNEETKYAEDLEFNVKYFDKISKINFVKSRLYFYRQRKGSLVHSKFYEKKLHVFNGLGVAEKLDKNIYIKTQDYIKSLKCVSSMDMLFRICRSDYDNYNVIKKLYDDLKNNAKYVFKCKKNPGYLRGTMWITVPFLRLLLAKKLRRK